MGESGVDVSKAFPNELRNLSGVLTMFTVKYLSCGKWHVVPFQFATVDAALLQVSYLLLRADVQSAHYC